MVVGKNNKKCQSPPFVSHLIDSEQSENYNEFAMKCVSLIFNSYIFFYCNFCACANDFENKVYYDR